MYFHFHSQAYDTFSIFSESFHEHYMLVLLNCSIMYLFLLTIKTSCFTFNLGIQCWSNCLKRPTRFLKYFGGLRIKFVFKAHDILLAANAVCDTFPKTVTVV